jgi:hypothetical protein
LTGRHGPDRAARANPGYTSDDERYRRNCTCCSIAVEARLRGYAVIAAPLVNLPPVVVIDACFRRPDGRRLSSDCFRVLRSPWARNLIEAWPTGARGIVTMGRGARPGHAFAVVRRRTGLLIVDGQLNGRRPPDYFADSTATDYTVVRTDEFLLTPEALRYLMIRPQEVT